MSELIHTIVSVELFNKLKEKLGDDYEQLTEELKHYIDRQVDYLVEDASPYGLHNDFVGLFQVSFYAEGMADANKLMNQMEDAIDACHADSVCVYKTLTYKITKGDTIEIDG